MCEQRRKTGFFAWLRRTFVNGHAEGFEKKIERIEAFGQQLETQVTQLATVSTGLSGTHDAFAELVQAMRDDHKKRVAPVQRKPAARPAAKRKVKRR